MNDSTTDLNTRMVAMSCSMACAVTIVLLFDSAFGTRPHSPVAQLKILTISALVGSFWGYQGWRCADAMNALKTTSFVLIPFIRSALTRFPLLLIYGSYAVLFAYPRCGFNWVGAIVTLVWCSSVLSFVANGSAALDLHEGREPFMVTAKFAHGLGGVFGTILAHFTFRGHPVLDRVPKSAPTLILAIVLWFSAPTIFALAVRNTLFTPTPDVNRDLTPLSEMEVLGPLDGFTGKARPIGEPRALTKQEMESLSRSSGGSSSLVSRRALNKAMEPAH